MVGFCLQENSRCNASTVFVSQVSYFEEYDLKMKKLPIAIVLGIIASLFVLAGQSKFGLFATVAQQTEVTLPEPDLSAFPLPIVKVSVKEIANYPIDPLLTNFKSLKQHIDTTVLLVGDHIFFANDKTVYRLTHFLQLFMMSS